MINIYAAAALFLSLSLFWFTIGALSAAWFMFSGRNGTRPIPKMPGIVARVLGTGSGPPDERPSPAPRPNVSIPQHSNGR